MNEQDYQALLANHRKQFSDSSNGYFPKSEITAHSCLSDALYAYSLQEAGGDIEMASKNYIYKKTLTVLEELSSYARLNQLDLDLTDKAALSILDENLTDREYDQAVKNAFLKINNEQCVTADGVFSGKPIQRLEKNNQSFTQVPRLET